jgi:hypothetical protein
MTTKQLMEAEQRYREELQGALEGMIEDTIRKSALPNAIAFIGVVVGSFLVTLGLLVLVTGG